MGQHVEALLPHRVADLAGDVVGLAGDRRQLLAPLIVKRLVPTLASVAESGVGVLLIEQFAHVALGLAERAYVVQGGRIRYEGTARELQDNPELLHSAYLRV